MQILNSNKINLFAVIITAILINFAFVSEIKAQPCPDSTEWTPVPQIDSVLMTLGNDTCWMYFEYITRIYITASCDSIFDLNIQTVYFRPGPGCGDIFASMFQAEKTKWFDSAMAVVIMNNPWGTVPPPRCPTMSKTFYRYSNGGCYMWGGSSNPGYPFSYTPCTEVAEKCSVLMRVCWQNGTPKYEVLSREGPTDCKDANGNIIQWCSPACQE